MVSPFIDVKADDYFFKAVLWAKDEGIIQGTSGSEKTGDWTFEPHRECSRAEIVCFIERGLN